MSESDEHASPRHYRLNSFGHLAAGTCFPHRRDCSHRDVNARRGATGARRWNGSSCALADRGIGVVVLAGTEVAVAVNSYRRCARRNTWETPSLATNRSFKRRPPASVTAFEGMCLGERREGDSGASQNRTYAATSSRTPRSRSVMVAQRGGVQRLGQADRLGRVARSEARSATRR